MLISKLRRTSATAWVIVALIILAAIPLGPICAVPRYLLVAFVPGLAIWKYFRSADSSIVDLILYPSLLSILMFSWIALAWVALGTDLSVAGVITIAIFLGVGSMQGWSVPITRTKGDGFALGLTAVLVIFLLVIPFAANSFQAVAWDAPLHAAIVSRILAGVVPPDSPMMAGQPANYYWLYHFYSAVLMRITGLSVYQVFAVLNVHAFGLFVLAGYKIAGRLTKNLFGRFSAVWMLVFGLNAFGWIIFFTSGSANPDLWYSLVAPFAMVKGYSPSLGSLVHEFLDGSPFALAFAFNIAWLDIVLTRMEGERSVGFLCTGTLMLATLFYLYPLSAVFVIAGSLAAVGILVLINRTARSELSALLIDFGAIMFVAALVTAPYGWNILHGKTGTPLSITLNSAYLKSQSFSMFATIGLGGVIALPGFWLAFREQQRGGMVLTLFAGVSAIAALITHVALEAEYKLIYLLVFGLAPLAALSWNVWKRTLATRVIFVLALAVSAPTNVLTSYCFATQPPRESRDPTRGRLFSWIRNQTPANAVLVEFPWWEKYQTSDAAYFYLDRFWFDIGVYANRRQLIGYGAPMLEQWGYRDIGLRQALAGKLTKGAALAPDDISYLERLAAPIVVVTNISVVGNEGFDSATYLKVYEDGDLRAYRVLLPKS